MGFWETVAKGIDKTLETTEQKIARKKKEELELGIRVQRLKRKRAGELQGLTEEQQNYLINKWLEEGEEADITGKSRSGKPMFIEKPLSKHEAEMIIRARGTRCQYPHCHETYDLDVHHIVPRSQGGSNEGSNLIVLCPTHHRKADRGSIPATRLKMYVQEHRRK